MINEFEKKVADEYNSRFIKYGAQPKSSLWFSEQRQILRFDLIIDCIKKNNKFNKEDLCKKYLNWWKNGAFETGPTFASVFTKIEKSYQ